MCVISHFEKFNVRGRSFAEGWRFQRDTAAYVQPYFAPGGDRNGPGARVTPEFLKTKLDAAVRYHDM